MILVADSVMPPSAAQIAAAKAAGYGAWLGGFAGPNILYGWADADFRRVIAGGLLTGAYCSRLADPLAMKARAAGLGIVLIQDDESGIAPFDIAATDAFLVASGASLYGGSQVMSAHYAHAHPAYVYAGYPGGVQTTTWPPGVAAPPQPKGWQWANANLHPQPFGSVDTSNFEPGLLEGAMTPEQAQQLQALWDIFFEPYAAGDAPWSNVEVLRRQLADLGAPYTPNSVIPFQPDPMPAPSGGGLTAAQAAALASVPDLVAAVGRIEAALKGA